MIADAAATAPRVFLKLAIVSPLMVFFIIPPGFGMSIKQSTQRMCGMESPSLRGAQRRSNPALRRHGLLRGACHRARIRATRWLAMTAEAVACRLPLPLAAHEIEIAAFVGLQDGLVEQMRVTALRPVRCRSRP